MTVSTYSKGPGVPALALAATLLLGSTTPMQADERTYDPEAVAWKKITFRAAKLIFKTSADVELSTVSEEAARAAMVEPSQGEPMMPDGESMLVTTTNSFLGRHSLRRLWLDPENGESYQNDVTETGSRTRYKVYRFTDRGVDVIRRYPANQDEKGQSIENWSDVSTDFDAYPREQWQAYDVTEASALFYVASAAGLRKPGDVLEIPIYAREKLSLAVIKAEELTRIRVDYDELSEGSSRTVSGEIDALRLSASARSLDGEETPVELIGLENIELFVDPETGIPLQLTGSVDVIGKVRARLSAVELR